jgi:DNA-binding IclR family transcriptional regulator
VLRTLDLLAANPFLTNSHVVGKLGVAPASALRAIGQLERAGILRETTQGRRNRVWCAQALLDILEEPARLTPENPFP